MRENETREEKVKTFINELKIDDILGEVSDEILYHIESEFILESVLKNLNDEDFDWVIRTHS